MQAGSLALWAFPQTQVQRGEQRKYYGIRLKAGLTCSDHNLLECKCRKI